MRMLSFRHPPGAAARFCAYASIISGILIGCGKSETAQPQPPEPEYRELPALRPFPRDAGGQGAPVRNTKPGTRNHPVSGCPAEMAQVEGFCIDRYEIHLEDKTTGAIHHYFNRPPISMANLAAVSGAGVFPQGYMSQEMAAKACANAGKRLCTLDEWRRACRGRDGNAFPYGASAQEGACNVNKRSPHILDKHFPDVPHLKRTGGHFNDPALLQDPDYLAKTGGFATCMTPEGVYDLDGNLSEWVSDTVMKGAAAHGTFAGDAFSGFGMQGCARSTDAHSSGYHDYSMGTRCCKDAPGR